MFEMGFRSKNQLRWTLPSSGVTAISSTPPSGERSYWNPKTWWRWWRWWWRKIMQAMNSMLRNASVFITVTNTLAVLSNTNLYLLMLIVFRPVTNCFSYNGIKQIDSHSWQTRAFHAHNQICPEYVSPTITAFSEDVSIIDSQIAPGRQWGNLNMSHTSTSHASNSLDCTDVIKKRWTKTPFSDI